MMKAADTIELSNVINGLNAHRMASVQNRVHAFLGLLLAVAIAVGGAFALIHFGTPCEGADLCLAAVAPTHRNWMQRMVDRYQAWRLRYHIGIAAKDLHYQEEQLTIARWECEHLPLQLKVTRDHIEALENQLRALGAPVEA